MLTKKRRDEKNLDSDAELLNELISSGDDEAEGSLTGSDDDSSSSSDDSAFDALEEEVVGLPIFHSNTWNTGSTKLELQQQLESRRISSRRR